jgi:hypothetical protein
VRIRSQQLATRRVGDDLMVLDLRSSKYFTVGGSGAFILDLLRREDVSVEEIVQHVSGAFAVDAERARADTETFLRRLDEAGLLDWGTAGRRDLDAGRRDLDLTIGQPELDSPTDPAGQV